ncbi:MAG: metalloregulator ArsR/SmtB family transcription factor [Candidatus Omnitrophica bacterium]|nr:metalloregulator ArsR/SmtB family transcription factor [Candidatus Omnitrophota bacterium]MBU4479753.1 metalloregulator ArsR/SmtB family transcription factor [Candidatus Omnitrophota bacterium]
MGSDISIKDLDNAAKASADMNRIRILNMLRIRKMCVCEIAFVLGIAQPSVSRHLKKLKSAGFIRSGNDGFWTNYYLAPQNAYARTFVNNLDKWVGSDSVVLGDNAKAKKADRERLCCA